jgi:hypothetical protein
MSSRLAANSSPEFTIAGTTGIGLSTSFRNKGMSGAVTVQLLPYYNMGLPSCFGHDVLGHYPWFKRFQKTNPPTGSARLMHRTTIYWLL